MLLLYSTVVFVTTSYYYVYYYGETTRRSVVVVWCARSRQPNAPHVGGWVDGSSILHGRFTRRVIFFFPSPPARCCRMLLLLWGGHCRPAVAVAVVVHPVVVVGWLSLIHI